MQPGTATLTPDGTRIALAGDWVLACAPALAAQVEQLQRRAAATPVFDASGIGRLDTAGASLLLQLGGETGSADRFAGLGARQRALLDTVVRAMHTRPSRPRAPNSVIELFANAGKAVETLWRDLAQLVGFIGLILASLAQSIVRPQRWRVTSLFFHIEQTGLNAVPIVALLSFLVGAVVAFLGATILRDFGATVFTVELISYSFLREFGVLLTAIMIAGRSGSAFTAQIGSMKAREEVDAIRTMGLSPVDVLVLPRVLALLISMPLLSFLAMVAGIVGGAVVCIYTLDISPGMFVHRLNEMTQVKHFWVGMAKAPLFAFLIAAIGCLEGFKVSGSAESVGAHTTSSVVQSIFVVILVDALAAIFFMEIGW
ncbi:ABC transporter permease [Dokdonella koreensis]|uniref:ABC transporter permease n=1 Tax=Dokdonella koreensis DS-123 TaxID=1300342 RepID=A0A160DXL1_9GAMM|nr:ABC transporter permease [Dokdonella koreensis]ANB19100.1 Putative ABC transporter permease [Dokdonella koreensis DS-123]